MVTHPLLFVMKIPLWGQGWRLMLVEPGKNHFRRTSWKLNAVSFSGRASLSGEIVEREGVLSQHSDFLRELDWVVELARALKE